MFSDILFTDTKLVYVATRKNNKKFALVQTKVSLYIGNTFQLETTNVKTTKRFGISEQVKYRSLDENIVRVKCESKSGILSALSPWWKNSSKKISGGLCSALMLNEFKGFRISSLLSKELKGIIQV